MKIILSSIFLFFLISLSCKKGKNNPESCNGKNTRREVKLAIDSESSEIDTVAILTTVKEIGEISVAEIDKSKPRQSIEKKVYQITAEVHKLSKHRDGDWKVKLTDGNDKFINCESPNMGCSHIDNSIFFTQMSFVRNWIEQEKDNLEGKTVTITGVAFIDIDHNTRVTLQRMK